MGTDVGKEYNAARTRSEHDSDCSIHNEPAYPAGACDCILSVRKDSEIYTAFDKAYADYKKEPVMDTEDMQEKAAEQHSKYLEYEAIAKRNAAYITEQQQKAYYENMAERQTKALGESMKQTISERDYKKNRESYTAYLLMCVRLGDWHGVSDAANDLRVLEAKEGK
jgi:hypothetical protein